MARGEPVVREDLKRFRKEYAQPVQLRYVTELKISTQKSFDFVFFPLSKHTFLCASLFGGTLFAVIRKLCVTSVSKKVFWFYSHKFVVRLFWAEFWMLCDIGWTITATISSVTLSCWQNSVCSWRESKARQWDAGWSQLTKLFPERWLFSLIIRILILCWGSFHLIVVKPKLLKLLSITA